MKRFMEEVLKVFRVVAERVFAVPHTLDTVERFIPWNVCLG